MAEEIKVLFVTLNALEVNTSVTISNIGLLKGLKMEGAEVTILMPQISEEVSYYDNRCDLSEYKVLRIADPVSNIVVATKGSRFKTKIKSLLSRLYKSVNIFDRGTLLLNRAKEVDVYREYYDYVISTSDPKSSHLFVNKLVKNGLRYGEWIQHWGDPLYADITGTTIYPRSIIKKVERRVLKSADKIVYVSPFTLEQQKAVHPKESQKMRFVPLPCDETYATEEIKTVREDSLVLSYLGDYSSGVRNILPLYEACKENQKYKLIVAGNTDLKLKECENITVYPRVSYEKIKEIESMSDVYVCVNNLYGTQIPGKIYYASASSKPILILMEEDRYIDMEKYLKEYNRYICCKNDKKSIIECMSEIGLLADKYDCPPALFPEKIIKEILR